MFARSLAVLLLLAGPAFAQSKVVIGGIDQRGPQIENQFLAQQIAEKAQDAARAVALLTIEKQDNKSVAERAANLKEWLDLAWPAYEATTK